MYLDHVLVGLHCALYPIGRTGIVMISTVFYTFPRAVRAEAQRLHGQLDHQG
jgi:hypothetical protein